MSDFKVGDKVKCITLVYPDWCDVEMVVQSTKNDSRVYCSHPKKGIGMFKEHELVKVTEEKPASLELQKQELLKQIEQIDKQIAAKKYEEQMELGEKEVEISLTVKEFAWLFTGYGRLNMRDLNDSITTQKRLNPDFEDIFIPAVGDEYYALYTKAKKQLIDNLK